ncbi:MAG: hypothetical protein IKG42_04970 [Clostridia bacterium]|nr:hypothetical protein [Clostridia bacterium]
MKIKNDFINIKIGKKQYNFKNLILDEYLSRIIKRQIDVQNLTKVNCDIQLKYLLIKFDTPFGIINSSMDLHNQNFDICLIHEAICEQELSANTVSIKYTYTADSRFLVYNYATGEYSNINNYNGRKITAIGFNSWNGNDEGWQNQWPVCAVLDTSNYNLYLQENEFFTVVRKDIITTDADFYTEWSIVKAPAHLCPKGIEKTSGSYFNDNYGILKSVGFGYYKDEMIEELLIGTDIDVTQNNNELILQPLINPIFNNSLEYLNNNLFPSNKLFTKKENYKFILLKYELYQIEYVQSGDDIVPSYIDTGEFYLQSLPINEYGTGNFKIKYERG